MKDPSSTKQREVDLVRTGRRSGWCPPEDVAAAAAGLGDDEGNLRGGVLSRQQARRVDALDVEGSAGLGAETVVANRPGDGAVVSSASREASSTSLEHRAEVGLSLAPSARPRHVVVDTTGLKVYGAGEWYVRKYGMGRGRRRT